MTVEAFAHWKRLDVPGRDACWLEHDSDHWTLYGAALFSHERGPAFVDYNITYDREWATIAAHLRGRIGAENFEYHITRQGHEWTVNAGPPITIDADQLDLGFTPATNYAQVKRILEHGQDITVAWFDLGETQLSPLRQIYSHTNANRIDYQSPAHDYAATLTLADNGFIADYPGLWAMESDRQPS